MKILVTGANGFLGRQCVAILRRDGHEVVTTDQRGEVEKLGSLCDASFTASLPMVDTVIHCAAVQYVSPDMPLWMRDRYFFLNNVLATKRLCARYNEKGVHMVNVGTSMMYRQCGRPIYRVDSELVGQGVYSRTKLAAWQYLKSSFSDAACVIPCIIGGAGREGLFRGFVKSIQAWNVAMFPGSGEHLTHMVHVQDLAALVGLCVAHRARGVFNAGGPRPLSIRQWVDTVSVQLGQLPARCLSIPLAPLALLSTMSGYRILAREQLLMLEQAHVLDVKESVALGWQPLYTNEAIVQETAAYIVSSSCPT